MIFKLEGEKWVFSMEITFNQPDLLITQLSDWLVNIGKMCGYPIEENERFFWSKMSDLSLAPETHLYISKPWKENKLI